MPPARIVFYLATLGGILFSARAVMNVGKGEPPDLAVAISAVGLYIAILLAGVLVLRLRMFADAVVRGPVDARGVVLTFDDGPDPVYTLKVLDLLDAYDAKATFFVIGRKVEAHPEIVEEIVKRGHDVGVHGFAHDRLFSLRGSRRVRRDLERAVKGLEKVTNERPTLFRPPIGHTNPTIARIADQLDLTVVGWSAAGRDGLAGADPKAVVSRITKDIDDGAIVLLHDAAERSDHVPAGVAALPGVLGALKDKNLRVARLRDWLDQD